MADPAIVACAANAWTKVATNVQAGLVHILTPAVSYSQTYRLTGGAAPTDKSEAVPFSGSLVISAPAAIDVYVYAEGSAGSVRVDV